MVLSLQTGVNVTLIGSMIVSLVVIIASIRWIKDLYRLKRDKVDGRGKGIRLKA